MCKPLGPALTIASCSPKFFQLSVIHNACLPHFFHVVDEGFRTQAILMFIITSGRGIAAACNNKLKDYFYKVFTRVRWSVRLYLLGELRKIPQG